jgi:hypothetical protein
MSFKRICTYIGLASVSLLIAGCNNDSNNNASNPNGSGDAFIAQVRQQTDGANALSDTAQPVDITAVVETSPEQNEPETVSF